MQNELKLTVSLSEEILSLLGGHARNSSNRCINNQATTLLASIAQSGIPRIEDSRVPPLLASKLHELTEAHFKSTCHHLQETRRDLSLASLHHLAMQWKATYVALYERKVSECAVHAQKKACASQKQPFANDILTYAFERSQMPTRREREVLASLTGMTVEQVRVWFQNRRSRTKKKATILHARPALQLDDVLQRVKIAHATTKSMKPDTDDEFDDNDSHYSCGSERATTLLPRDPIPLSTPSATVRSYPAAYVAQPLSTNFRADPPVWRRTPNHQPLVCASTVTLDELARSMGRLTLRHRRVIPRASADDLSTSTSSSPSPAATAAKKPKNKAERRDPETGRKIAGGRRSLSTDATAPAAATPSDVILSPSASPVSCDPPRSRKRPGPPRRKPVGRALSRQTSHASIGSASSSSTDSSRSSSYASDSSFSSCATDSSSTSIETTAAAISPPLLCQQACLDLAPSETYTGMLRDEGSTAVPVYDLSSLAYDLSDAPAPDLATLLNDPSMLQLLESTSSLQPQLHAIPQLSAAGDPSLDVGMTQMGVLLDCSTEFPNLHTLLPDVAGADASLSLLQEPLGGPPFLEHHAFSWNSIDLGIRSQA